MGEQPLGLTCEIGRRLADSKLSPTSFAVVDCIEGGVEGECKTGGVEPPVLLEKEQFQIYKLVLNQRGKRLL